MVGTTEVDTLRISNRFTKSWSVLGCAGPPALVRVCPPTKPRNFCILSKIKRGILPTNVLPATNVFAACQMPLAAEIHLFFAAFAVLKTCALYAIFLLGSEHKFYISHTYTTKGALLMSAGTNTVTQAEATPYSFRFVFFQKRIHMVCPGEVF